MVLGTGKVGSDVLLIYNVEDGVRIKMCDVFPVPNHKLRIILTNTDCWNRKVKRNRLTEHSFPPQLFLGSFICIFPELRTV